MDKQLPIVYKPTLKPTIYLSKYIMSNYIKVGNWSVVEGMVEGLRVRIKITNKINQKNYFRLCHIFLYFFLIDLLFSLFSFYITRSGRQKYELIGNFKFFMKMRLHPIDMQTRRQKKNSIFPYFSVFLLTDLILSNQLYH